MKSCQGDSPLPAGTENAYFKVRPQGVKQREGEQGGLLVLGRECMSVCTAEDVLSRKGGHSIQFQNGPCSEKSGWWGHSACG